MSRPIRSHLRLEESHKNSDIIRSSRPVVGVTRLHTAVCEACRSRVVFFISARDALWRSAALIRYLLLFIWCNCIWLYLLAGWWCRSHADKAINPFRRWRRICIGGNRKVHHLARAGCSHLLLYSATTILWLYNFQYKCYSLARRYRHWQWLSGTRG